MTTKYVYLFANGKADGRGDMKDTLGGKGAGLAEMTNAALPVPPGFTITTQACNAYYAAGEKFPDGMWEQTIKALREVEKAAGKKLGDASNPLLVSVRSGAKFSMPGMMDTVLNLGLNEETLKGLARLTSNERFAYDAYRRFIQMFGKIVLGVDGDLFEHALNEAKRKARAKLDTDLTADHLKAVCEDFKKIIRRETGSDFPTDPYSQLEESIKAVFRSWNGERAIAYRRREKIPDDLGTAVNIVTMVFGNMGNDSGTGVAFTRNPATGEKELFGDYLSNAQGEDVVAGIRTPKHINELQQDMPEIYNQFVEVARKLERHYRDMQDIEFTVERGRLWMLQTRNGKRTGPAAVKLAVDMVREGLIDERTALQRIPAGDLDQLLHKMIDPAASLDVLTRGINASPGAASGRVVFTPKEAEAWAAKGEAVILVRRETSPEDVRGMDAAQAILTSTGGPTCIAGDTKILTDRGFMTARDAHDAVEAGENLLILSFDTMQGKAVWKSILSTGKSVRSAIKAAVSQTGRSELDTITITPDHKMFTMQGRKLIKKPIAEIIRDEEFICVVDRIPGFEENDGSKQQLAYLVGAILTDGYIRVRGTKGNVTFTQKPTPEKQPFIQAVESAFEETTGYVFTGRHLKHTESVLRGRVIVGDALDITCSRRAPAVMLSSIRDNLVPWVMGLTEEELLHFLAGVIDGDGTFNRTTKSRINIFASKKHLIEGVVLACLRLGIMPQVTCNRTISNIQIVEQSERLLGYTRRVKGEVNTPIYESKLFSARGLFADIVDDVNRGGKIRCRTERNLLVGAEKARRTLEWCEPPVREEIEQMLDADVRMYRVRKLERAGEIEVYNFEVSAEFDLDKNYVAFTSMLTPLLISNSHAAVVARGWGKPCIVGAGEIDINYAKNEFSVNGRRVRRGDWITIDGTTGRVITGHAPLIDPELGDDFHQLMQWADKYRRMKVRTNADTPDDAAVARGFGAEGIGLCRTEHMFFEGDRIDHVRQMILGSLDYKRIESEIASVEADIDKTTSPRKRKELAAHRNKLRKEIQEPKRLYKGGLSELLKLQRKDFEGIFRAMDGLPVTIRTLDPPLHEFLPHDEEGTRKLARKLKTNAKHLWSRVQSLHEANPMLGHRGCRLGVVFPEITEMQARAIFEAAASVQKRGIKVLAEIMIPLVSDVIELRLQADVVRRVAGEVMKKTGQKIEYLVGTMIELPRAALMADRIAEVAEFFSFGTNDLTQTTFGISRDDSGKFLPFYIENRIFKDDPFQALDQEGVGQLVRMGTEKGRAARPDLKVGICGEHGGEPSSVGFCHRVGLNYVSCSPYRVPIARLAAAQAALGQEQAISHTA